MNALLGERLKNARWGEFKIIDLFTVKNTHNILSNEIVENSGEIPYLCASSENNGVSSHISFNADYLEEGNCIFIGGKTFVVSYQPDDFFSNDSHNLALYLKQGEKRTKNIQTFMVSCIQKGMGFKYSWGNSISSKKIQDDTISLPVTSAGEIDFDFMESFIRELEEERIRELEEERIRELAAYLKVSGLDNYELSKSESEALAHFEKLEWKEFKIGDLFERISTNKLPYKAKDLPQNPIGEFTLPCLTSSFMNQGLNYYAPKKGATILKNVISIPSNSDVYRAYFQSNDFTVLSDAYAIRWKNNFLKILPAHYLFMVACINQVTDLPIYSYKNKLGGWNIVKEKNIMLPVRNGIPDYDAMETFISAVQKLVIKDVVLYADRKIAAAKRVIAGCPEQKREILKTALEK